MACGPPCSSLVGLEWPPALLPSAELQSPCSCTWKPCKPGGTPCACSDTLKWSACCTTVSRPVAVLPAVGLSCACAVGKLAGVVAQALSASALKQIMTG